MSNQEPIAIVGTGCRFPGQANTPSRLWDAIRDPQDLLTAIPTDRFSVEGFYHEDGQYHGHENVKHAYLLAGNGTHRRFDARFFGINAAEANVLDPQVRLLLEVVYEALEASGLVMDGLRGSDTAVYAGLMVADYEHIMLRDEDHIGTYHVTGTSRSLVSNRVSYFFDWHGPSMTIDTACSSSLVAVHQAVQQLRSGQSRVAVATGANLILDPQTYIGFSKLRMLSPDGRSRMWDAGANGYARGEGIAAVILKTLSAAEADGDHIECIIRETGVNQDGKTPGITVPSAAAQAQLIRNCYFRAGLDATNPVDQPQYFEAHGTGTLIGDPVEAEAISSAFFSKEGTTVPHSGPMFVGSIKTVIGHTEATAGLSAILKASLALQNATIPPNLLFHSLNRNIEPFYANLKVPTSPMPWPVGASVRRASVNSFGFGGVNAHAILEHYTHDNTSTNQNFSMALIPFIFSATTETSLTAYLVSFLDYLRANQAILSARDLAYTLYRRRTHFAISHTSAALTISDLCVKIEKTLSAGRDTNQLLGTKPSQPRLEGHRPQILGVFTGQGAQWASQGYELIANCPVVQEILMSMETRLSQLPPEHRPTWSLLEELQKDASSSRISQAELCQPLCTAIQIVQVDIMRAAGVKFSAVVGHSSGEIAAAYAAGKISAEDAICIAYYRGMYCSRLARGSDGQSGAMMAVETTLEDIQQLCDSPAFEGSVCIAAVNSPKSVTVSGNRDSIEEMQIILEDEKKFSRILRIDKAYHSSHMSPCSEAYIEALAALNIESHPIGSCAWFSSVDPGNMADETVKSDYWSKNLVSPVLFMRAIQLAWSCQGPFDLVVELGPHAALKGPALQTINDLSTTKVPYTSLFYRNRNSIETISEALGYMWSHLGKNSVNFQSYDAFLSGSSSPGKLIKGLPTYAWDHENEYWHESRLGKAVRSRQGPLHELLGHITPNSTEQEVRWRQLLRPKEIPWLHGHKLQGQIVLPAAAYIVLALEAALQVCRGKSVALVDIADLDISRALTFDHDDSAVEAIFSLTGIQHKGNLVTTRFAYHAAGKTCDKPGSLYLVASGRIQISLSENSAINLTVRRPPPPNLHKVASEDFYQAMQKLGYGYSHPFTALSNLERGRGTATGFISPMESTGLLLHPGVLDAALQSTFLVHSTPNDGGIWTMYVPRTIRNIRINPGLCASAASQRNALLFDSVRTAGIFSSDIDIFPSFSPHAMVQIETLECTPLASATEGDDKEIFSTTVWDVASPDASLVTFDEPPSPELHEIARLLERVSIFHLRELDREIPRSHPSRSKGPLAPIFKFVSHVAALTLEKKLQCWDPEWEHDTAHQITAVCTPYMHVADVKLLHTMGTHLVDIVKGTKQAIEIGMEDDLLSKYYENAIDMSTLTRHLARIVGQIVHRYPHTSILEIGAGTGGATKGIFQMTKTFTSYTFTDISPGFFESAKQLFSNHANKMDFKVLDINQDIKTQGFTECSYDLVVASMVLHTTSSLLSTLRNIRRLLKPGGYLVVLEGLPDVVVRYGAIFGAFPGWWAGRDDGRVLSPFVDLPEWNRLLHDTGFSGCDTTTSGFDPVVMPLTVFVSQAVDSKILYLRDPLSSSPDLFNPSYLKRDLIILGETNSHHPGLVGQITSHLGPRCGTIRKVKSLAEMSSLRMTNSATIISLLELDKPFFQNPNSHDWEALKLVLVQAESILWVTHGRRSNNPYANMTTGLLRSSLRELPGLNVQLLDFEKSKDIDAHIIAQMFLRFMAARSWERVDLHESILATIEPEITIDSGRAWIPRLIPDQAMNNRYNSSRRNISSMVNLGDREIALTTSGPRYSLCQQPDAVGSAHRRQIRVSYSYISAVRVTEFGSMYLVLGKDSQSDERVLALSTTHASVIHLREGMAITTKVSHGDEARLLCYVSYQLAASFILRGLTENDHVLVHEPVPILATILAEEAKLRGINFLFTTRIERNDTGWLKIDQTATQRFIRSHLPRNISVFVDFSQENASESANAHIRSCLPIYCRREDKHTLFPKEAWAPWGEHINAIRNQFQISVRSAMKFLAATQDSVTGVPIIPVSDISGYKHETMTEAIVNWTSSSLVPIQIQPVDTQLIFSDSKTYWLVGLTSGLGLSLSEWLVDHGAKYIVLSSRKPEVDTTWLKMMSSRGAVIKVYSCDITNNNEVIRLHAEICSSLPRIGGVAQGAMVLEDTPIRDMPLDSLLKVVRPKVDGSLHLNSVLANVNLDFFVFFSSTSAITGNPGQSNYSAANLFMSSLAEQRRQRGLAASVINIGPVLGAGYITRNRLDMTGVVKSGAHMFMSERDFHQLFAEAVALGRPGSSAPIEVTTGLKIVRPSDEIQPVWSTNPYMSHFIRDEDDKQRRSGFTPDVSAKAKLALARNKEEILRIIRDALVPKLSALYQISIDTLSREDLGNLRLDGMGTDSLLAIEIRSWFMKELHVNIPTLKILSGMTVRELLDIAADQLPTSLVPNLQIGITSSSSVESCEGELERHPETRAGSETQDDSECNYDVPVSSNTSTTDSPDDVESTGEPIHLFYRCARISFSQEMFWFVLTFLENKASLNHTASFRITGKIRQDKLDAAFKSVVRQHQSLRTCFFEQDGQLMQGVIESGTACVECRQIYNEEEVNQVVGQLQDHTFDMGRGESLKIVLLSLSATTHYLILATHGLAMDGWSMRVLLKDLHQHYTLTHQSNPPLQYLDYSVQQRSDVACGKFESDLQYWKNELVKLPPPLPILRISQATSRLVLKKYENERVDIRIKAATKAQIKTVCRQYKVTPFHFYLTVFRALVARLAGTEDFSVGISESNRSNDHTMDSIGMFVNVLPLCFRTQTSMPFSKLLEETRDKAYEALAHSQIPFQVLLNQLDIPRSATSTPIFQCFVDYRLGQQEKMEWAGCQLELVSFQASKLAYDVTLDIIDDPNGDCLTMLIVRKDLYNKQCATLLANGFQQLVREFASQPDSSTAAPEIFEQAEVEKSLSFCKGPQQECQWPETVIHRIDEVAQLKQHSPAVRWRDGAPATYGDILDHISMIVRSLLATGISRGLRIAVMQEPTPHWISSILAIMRVGAVYLPLDLSSPWARLATIVKGCQPSLILVDNDTERHIGQLCAPWLRAINVSKLELGESTTFPIAATSKGAAALLYTSGSSSIPKGIILKHEGLRNWLESSAQVYDIGSEHVLQQSSSGFDMSLIQIFIALSFGGCLHLVPREYRSDGRAISQMVHSEGITFTFTCTSELSTWFKYGSPDLLYRSAWKRAVTGGEPGVDRLLMDFVSLKKADLRLFHAYGPTETSFTATGMELFYNEGVPTGAHTGDIPVGYPLPNYCVYILDDQMRPVPPNVLGEIYIGGPGVADGYFDNSTLTAEKFIENPFATSEDLAHGWNTLHRTGDLGRWQKSGAMLIEGRVAGDTQVKLRGLRIDLREIENALFEIAKGVLSEVVVSARPSSRNPEFLVAYVVLDQNYPRSKAEKLFSVWQSQLDLPRYMRPAIIIPIDEMPKTNTLKLDRRAISDLPLPEATNAQESELNRSEERLKRIWKEVISEKVIKSHSVGPDTDFFHVGGTSLLLLELRARIRAELDVELSLVEMFVSSTLSGMACMIDSQGRQSPPTATIDWDQETQLSPAILQSATSPTTTRRESQEVILTGSTGYLGRALLDALIKDPTVGRIHCIAVRNACDRHDMLTLDKTILHEGDLCLPRLGLSKDGAKDMFSTADKIIHNGADVSYMKTYESLRQSNLQSTKELVEMSLPRQIPTHYISSGGACIFAAAAIPSGINPVSVAQHPPPSDGSHGYASSKWASEVFLEKLHHRTGWPIWIHRPSNIARTGAPGLDFIQNLRYYSCLLNAVPVARGVALGKVDSVTLDNVVKGIMDSTRGEDDSKLRFLHHIGGVDLSLDDIRTWVAEGYSANAELKSQHGEMEEITFGEWTARAGAEGMHPAIAAILQAFVDRSHLTFPKLMA
ncbi:amino acid adenylation domain-containing protein [Hypomontagnella monticulosa]|nr:amino acid adenylation domain-containing protein [Hypomontagnella monticulosa]